MHSNIFLTGFRGTGKSTVATLLASKLSFASLDLDIQIESTAGCSIAEIFQAGGEPAFRKLESEQLCRVAEFDDTVIALGGGAVLAEENREVIKKSGCCVWLTASPERIAHRLAEDATTRQRRPALTSLNSEDEIRQLLTTREPIYRSVADTIVDTEQYSPEEVAELLYKWFVSRRGDS